MILKSDIKKIMVIMLFFLCMQNDGFAKNSHKSHEPKKSSHSFAHANKKIKKRIAVHHQSANRISIKKKFPKKEQAEKNKPHHFSERSSEKSIPHIIVQKNNVAISALPTYSLSSMEKKLVDFVRNTIVSLRYSVYKLGGTRVDPSRGVYVLDCSAYVDHILKATYPRAYLSLVSSTGSEKPTSNDFYHYFVNLSDRARHWNTIDEVERLRPGDILVFRYKNSLGYERGGHVMIVMDKPVQKSDAFLVRVTDSAAAGHSQDTRRPRVSGIGIGTLLLKVHPKTYQPYAYAWKVGSRWEKNVDFAMARPVDM